MSETSARLLKLLSLLQMPREWPGSELAERLGVSPRTIRRDIDRLRDLGYPVDATRGAVGGYRLGAGAAMPPLLLDDDEAVAITVGLRTATHTVDGIEEAAVRALAKLEQVLPSRLRHRVSVLGSATVPLQGYSPGVAAEHLTVLAAAVAGRDQLRFAYRSASGRPGQEPGRPQDTQRLVEPHRLVPTGRRWYLVAYDNARDDWRTFRVDRIRDPQPTGVRAPFRSLPFEDAAVYVTRRLSELAPLHQAVATLYAPASEIEDRLGRTGGDELEELSEGSCRLRTQADSLGWLAFRLVSLGCRFVVHEPPALVAYMRDLGARATQSVDDCEQPSSRRTISDAS
ncbi:helix-turn-helix transcriptional regulator [Streptomyces tendae]|uniref:Helix-turn-helix transcriptional regulator n=1 Tax=Streptomyces tendae TaxID=1932 RepID=A0ABW7S9K9_STRTE|nr:MULTISPECIES: YafY family protein [unclassified Streptomyces]MBQ0969414.1 YafY family transcriptional regulator [Streptomyces sp. RK74B]MBQ1009052.1 YafY family transcriptional regulator [Streptomyces sp. RK23]MZG15398.1 WYL domain-containing protein [Streptomyces sp. SID5914]BET45129.1 YafY family protein [Kitasatospora aureofaciens]